MFATFLLLLIFLLLQLMQAWLWVRFLLWGARWARVDDATRARAWLAYAGVLLLTPLALALEWLPMSATLIAAEQWTILLVLPIAVIGFVLRCRVGQALKCWLLTLASTVVAIALAFPIVLLVIRPFVFEAYVIPTNGMAPTLLGRRVVGNCVNCGGPAYVNADQFDTRDRTPQPGVCSKEWRLCDVAQVSPEAAEGDRIIASKYLRPRRWDIIAFRSPEDRTETFAMRLVGMPGEEVVIRDGAVWINGVKQTPPEPWRSLHYTNKLEGDFQTMWGSPEEPAKLGPDEYFVLGDFSERSHDSRLWHNGARGRPPYAVPATDVTGVVSHIYWPPNRWRILR